MPAAAAMVSMASEPSSAYYDGPKKSSGKFLTHFARRLRIGKSGSSKSKHSPVAANGGLLLEMDSEEDRHGAESEEIVILRHAGATPDAILTASGGGSSGAESSTMVLLVPAATATVVAPPPFKRANSFRQSLSYLLKRTRPKLTERSCTSDSDVVHELDEETAVQRAGKRPVLDAFLPEQLPAKRHSTGDIFNEDLDATVRAQGLGVGTGGRHRRVHSDSTGCGPVTTTATGGKPTSKAGQPK
uniref:Uncharacterized protein n=1 Tax=Anopheles epiroticus TaxID=199890 RepID=A0A182PCK2_9DIPT